MTSQPLPVHTPSDGVPATSRYALVAGRPRAHRRVARRLAIGLVAVLALAGAWTAYAVMPKDAGEPLGHTPTGPDVGVTGLRPAIATAITDARAAALEEGIELKIVSGKRSAATQQRLFEQAIHRYGSKRKASRWVLPPEQSQHVRGRAVDVGPPAAAAWLDRNGVRFGLCRRYDNEPWHFELLAPKHRKCPAREPHAGG